MEELPKTIVVRLLDLLLEDDKKRNRRDFCHAVEIIKNNWACPYSIWPIPNEDALSVINNKVNYNNLPFEDLNEVQKGMLFKDLREFIAQHISKGPMLCEVVEYEHCLKEKCQIFAPLGTESGGEYGLCREFKTAFKK